MESLKNPTVYDKNNPFIARLTENRQLNGEGSIKDTRHLVVDLSGSGLTYSCGDSLGVFATNRSDEVQEMLDRLGATGEETVTLPRSNEEVALREALTSQVSLAGPTKKLLTLLRERVSDEGETVALDKLMELPPDEMRDWLAARHIIDVLLAFPKIELAPQELVDQTRKLVPRLYSIASSPRAHPHEIHLTVAVVRYASLGRPRFGVCSTYLAERVPLQEAVVPVFVASSHFGLPDDPQTDIIMVGPGTGIAPFRAFLQERAATGATGRNWLFFGDQHEHCDFLYGDEFRQMQQDGMLTRMDCAWSRDQDFKIYVQDKIREQGRELIDWLQNGASIYVCGDAKRMAKDVEAALLDLAGEHLGLDPEAAAAWLKDLRRAKRYQKDVY